MHLAKRIRLSIMDFLGERSIQAVFSKILNSRMATGLKIQSCVNLFSSELAMPGILTNQSMLTDPILGRLPVHSVERFGR